MQGMLLAESAILLDFHSVRMSLLILRRIVVTLFTFRTCQCDSCAHNFHLSLVVFCRRPGRPSILGIKKRPTSIRLLSVP